jgi:Putative peptidoglycan binding domain/CHAP domain
MASDLHLTSPPMKGDAVKQVQMKLEALGFNPGAVDGEYGPATAAAVRAFQKKMKLEADGWVGPETRAALRGASTKKAVRQLAQVRSTGAVSPGQKALSEALKYIGVCEKPMNSNRTQFGKWFGVDGVPWCNIFVSYCFARGAKLTICAGYKGAGVYAKGCTYVPTTEAWLRSTGMWRGRTTPLAGDIAIYNWDGGVPDHIGIVEAYLGGGKFQAVEGNTAVGNDSNGGEVMRRLRYVSQVNGFGRVTG